MSKKKVPKYSKVPLDVSVHLRYLHQDLKLPLKELQKRYPSYSKTSIHRHSKKAIGGVTVDGRHTNKGRPPKLSERDVRHLESSLLINCAKMLVTCFRQMSSAIAVSRRYRTGQLDVL